MNMLRHFYNDFMALVPLQLPQLIDVTTMEKPQFYGDYVLLTFPLRDSYDLEEVMDMFEDDMELITLYHHIPMRVGEFGHSTCAYSNPAFGHMFKMNAKTGADGKVSHVVATVYDSLELLCSLFHSPCPPWPGPPSSRWAPRPRSAARSTKRST